MKLKNPLRVKFQYPTFGFINKTSNSDIDTGLYSKLTAALTWKLETQIFNQLARPLHTQLKNEIQKFTTN